MASGCCSRRARWVGTDPRAGVARPGRRILVVGARDRTRGLRGVSRADSLEARRGGSPPTSLTPAHPSRHPCRRHRTRPAGPARRVGSVVGGRGVVGAGDRRRAAGRRGAVVRHPQSESPAGARVGRSGRNRCGHGVDHGGGRRGLAVGGCAVDGAGCSCRRVDSVRANSDRTHTSVVRVRSA